MAFEVLLGGADYYYLAYWGFGHEVTSIPLEQTVANSPHSGTIALEPDSRQFQKLLDPWSFVFQ